MANFFTDNQDLQYYVTKGLDWAPIIESVERGDTSVFADNDEALEFYREVLATVGRFTAEEVAPRAAQIDRQGCHVENGEVIEGEAFRTVFKKLSRLGLHGLPTPRELGGLNAPALVYLITVELFARADVSVCVHNSFHSGMATVALLYSTKEGSTRLDPQTGQIQETRFRTMIDELIEGKAWGSMDLTEAHAGSDLAALRAKGVLGDDGIWRVTGQKIFITSGHAKYHFVIARTEPNEGETTGLAGLSLFLVKAYDDPKKKGGDKTWYATVDRVEEKMGHHGSATVAITFKETPGELIGERGDGFKLMLELMNSARVGVGFECLGFCESALRMAKAYAAERPSMGKTIDKHEMIADYLDEMQTDIQGIRALIMKAAVSVELAGRYQIARDYLCQKASLEWEEYDSLFRKHQARARRLTPLLKYVGSEKAVEMARRNIQIHGGAGYTKEYEAERLLRDALVFPIYEGTSQIQALMAMKDALMGIMKNPQAWVVRMAQAKWRALSSRDPLQKRVAKLNSQAMSLTQHLLQRTAAKKLKALTGKPVTSWADQFLKNWDPKRDFAFAMLHAERLIQVLSDAETGIALWEQASQHSERRELLERFLERAEPRVRHQIDLVHSTGERLLATLADEADAAEDAAQG
jgi:hypothetical protein